MSSFSTRWSVLQTHAVGTTDVDADGFVTNAALDRWLDAARDAYLDQCTHLTAALADGLTLGFRRADLPDNAAPGRPTTVDVSATATEVFPSSFVIALRLRTTGGNGDGFVDTECAVTLEDPVTAAARPIDNEIRDELIALEHSARHFN